MRADWSRRRAASQGDHALRLLGDKKIEDHVVD
jgi:hypothetical protein